VIHNQYDGLWIIFQAAMKDFKLLTGLSPQVATQRARKKAVDRGGRNRGMSAVRLGLGRIVALYHCSSTSYQTR
jgi:hypothetical protein